MAIDLSRGILPGLQVADQLQNSRVARESQTQADMIALANFDAEQEAAELDAQIAAQALSEVGSIARGDGRTTSVDLSGGEADPAAFMSRMGQLYMRAGATKRGKEFLEAGIDYQKKEADIEKTSAEADIKRLELMNETADWVARNLGENESEFNVFKSALRNPRNAKIRENLGEENVAILETMDWSPELVNYYRSKALSIKDQATLALQARGHERLERSAADTKAYRDALLQINRGNLEERRRERERKEKSEGPNIGGAATKAEFDTAKTAILQNVKALEGVTVEGEVATAVDHMADNIVGRAKILMAENKGIATLSEAIEQAILEAEAAGDFSVIEASSPKWFGLREEVTRTPKYERKGATPENPATLPQGDDEAAIMKRLVKGRFYTTPMGVLKWNGSSFDE